MFDLMSDGTENLKEALKCIAINITTLNLLLIEKNIITEDEFNVTRMRATHLIDQGLAEKQEEFDKEVEKKYPNLKHLSDVLKNKNDIQ